jgi:hypothetical protein
MIDHSTNLIIPIDTIPEIDYSTGKEITTMSTIKQFAEQHNLRSKSVEIDHNPNMVQNDWSRRAYHFKVTLFIRVNGKRHQLTIPFSMGSLNTGEPVAVDVLDCLVNDASSIENACDFEDWANELGLDSDSRSAEKSYKITQRQSQRLLKFLDSDSFIYDETEARAYDLRSFRDIQEARNARADYDTFRPTFNVGLAALGSIHVAVSRQLENGLWEWTRYFDHGDTAQVNMEHARSHIANNYQNALVNTLAVNDKLPRKQGDSDYWWQYDTDMTSLWVSINESWTYLEPITHVLFRVWLGDKLIALFPADREHFDLISSYEHVGGHGAANLDGIMQASRPARTAEYASLKRELETYPYNYNLKVYERADKRMIAKYLDHNVYE